VTPDPLHHSEGRARALWGGSMQQWRRHKACKGEVLVQTAVGESVSTTPTEGFGGCSIGGNLIVKQGLSSVHGSG